MLVSCVRASALNFRCFSLRTGGVVDNRVPRPTMSVPKGSRRAIPLPWLRQKRTSTIGLIAQRCSGLVEVFLKSGEDVSDFFRPAQVGHGVGYGIVALQLQQRSQFFLIEFLNTDLDVLRKHKIEEDLLYGVEACSDLSFCVRGPLRAGECGQGGGDVGQHIDWVTLFRVDSLLPFHQLIPAEFCLCPGIWARGADPPLRLQNGLSQFQKC